MAVNIPSVLSSQQSDSICATSRGRYGSRSVERSLHHPMGFHDPLKSLSPLAARLARELDEEEEEEEEVEGPSGAGSAADFNLLPRSFFSKWMYFPLVPDQKITNQSIAGFHSSTRSLLEKLEKDHPHVDAVESAAFPALTLLTNKLKECKLGLGMTSQEMESLEQIASTFLSTLDWTADAWLALEEQHEVSMIRKNVLYAVELLKHRRGHELLAKMRREALGGDVALESVAEDLGRTRKTTEYRGKHLA